MLKKILQKAEIYDCINHNGAPLFDTPCVFKLKEKYLLIETEGDIYEIRLNHIHVMINNTKKLLEEFNWEILLKTEYHSKYLRLVSNTIYRMKDIILYPLEDNKGIIINLKNQECDLKYAASKDKVN